MPQKPEHCSETTQKKTEFPVQSDKPFTSLTCSIDRADSYKRRPRTASKHHNNMNRKSQFYRCALPVLTCLSLVTPKIAFSTVVGNAKASNGQVLSELVRTGISDHDSRSYWNCSIAGNTATKNLHVRFWRSGDGFSGHHRLSWQSVSHDQLLLTVQDQSFSLTSISFDTADDPKTLFAQDSTGAAVTCEWSGPLRGSLNTEIQFDEAADLLESQLTSAESNKWACTIINKYGNESTLSLTFAQSGIGVQDQNTNFLWFVDRRYNVLLSFAQETKVLRNIQFFSDETKDDRFVAYELSDQIECRT